MVTIYQIALFVWFPFYMILRTGKVETSISAYSYHLEGNENAVFVLWLVGLAVSSLFQPLGIFSGIMAIGFTMAGMSWDHKRDPDSVEDLFHTLGTVVAVVAAAVGLYVVQGEWLHIPVGIGLAIPLLFVKNRIFWLEFLAMAMIAWRLL